MSMTVGTLIIVAIFAILVYGLVYMKKLNMSFNVRVIVSLVLGIIFGALLQLLVKDKELINKSMSWISIVGSGYVRLLRMIVFPLIFVSITKAIATQEGNVGRQAGRIMAVLMITVAIAALVGALTANLFHLSAEGLQSSEAELARGAMLEDKLKTFEAKPIQEQILEIIPINPFASLAGQGSNATLATVFFAVMVGLAAYFLKRQKSSTVDVFLKVLVSFSDVIMRMVRMVLRFTPYGVMALMANVTSTSNFSEILRLINFVFASYVAIFIMFIVHGLIISLHGISPVTFFKKSMSNLMFAFTSRSSAGTLPITINNLESNLGVPEGVANLSASLGTSIGQNGCAGIYPAMLAVMIAPVMGIDPMSIPFLIKLVVICALGSFGIVGVGGGATFAAIVVLSAMGFPIELAGLLIAIEPLIDMGRTALNVSDSLVAGVVAAKRGGELNLDVYNSKEIISE